MRTMTLLLLCVASAPAFAQQSLYVGLGLGNFDYEEDTTFAIIGKVADEVVAKKLFGGFEINDHFTIEVAYGKTDEIRQSGTAVVDPFGEVTGTVRTDLTITSLKAVGQLPLDWGVLLGGIGFFSSEADFTERAEIACCGTQSIGGTVSDNSLMGMIGVEWRFGRFGARYGVRLEYERYDIEAVDASVLGLAFSYGF